MKRLLLLLIPVVLLTSCESTWDSETKDMYLQSCKEEATWAKDDNEKQVYCDCMLDKLMKKYPKVSDFMEHVQDVMADTTLQECKPKVQ
jgi:PBP1b-binding outer membrane lipoprotein LpoB